MKKKRNYFKSKDVSFIFSLLALISVLVILSGCILPNGYPQRPEPDSSGRMSYTQHNGNIYYLDNASFFRRGNYSIKNERGQVIFRAKGNFFSRGMSVTLVGRNGSELFTITKKMSGYKSRYRIYSYGNLVANVYKKRTAMYERFYVNTRKGKNYTVQGDFMKRLYTFYYRGREVAEVSKRARSFSDKYKIEIAPNQNNFVILATSIIIDMENNYR